MKIQHSSLVVTVNVSLDDDERFIVKGYGGREVRVFRVDFRTSGCDLKPHSVVGTFIRKDGSDYADATTVGAFMFPADTIPQSVYNLVWVEHTRLLAEPTP